MTRESNVVGTAEDGRPASPEALMRTFDALPAVVRDAINDGVIQWCVFDSTAQIRRSRLRGLTPENAARAEAQSIKAWDEHEVREFSAEHAAKFKRPSPHVAAGATILRRDERHPTRRRI